MRHTVANWPGEHRSLFYVIDHGKTDDEWVVVETYDTETHGGTAHALAHNHADRLNHECAARDLAPKP